MMVRQHLYWKNVVNRMENENMPELKRLPLASYNNVWEFIQTLEYNDSEGIIFLEQTTWDRIFSWR